MTDPVGVTQDPRPVLMMGDEPDAADALSDAAIDEALAAWFRYGDKTGQFSFKTRMRAAIRAALEAQP